MLAVHKTYLPIDEAKINQSKQAEIKTEDSQKVTSVTPKITGKL